MMHILGMGRQALTTVGVIAAGGIVGVMLALAIPAFAQSDEGQPPTSVQSEPATELAGEIVYFRTESYLNQATRSPGGLSQADRDRYSHTVVDNWIVLSDKGELTRRRAVAVHAGTGETVQELFHADGLEFATNMPGKCNSPFEIARSGSGIPSLSPAQLDELGTEPSELRQAELDLLDKGGDGLHAYQTARDFSRDEFVGMHIRYVVDDASQLRGHFVYLLTADDTEVLHEYRTYTQLEVVTEEVADFVSVEDLKEMGDC